jgi:hypothetical protein
VLTGTIWIAAEVIACPVTLNTLRPTISLSLAAFTITSVPIKPLGLPVAASLGGDSLSLAWKKAAILGDERRYEKEKTKKNCSAVRETG